ncbi:MAG: large conductance mechanosensitive channel protein MscL [Candidatus Hydrogenedens sp.]|nr:large conductance mechanosensitive channel protein MscL [Candidatus Hydrogenedens sp.]
MMDEFRAFALKGNAVELAVAVVIGGAFGKIVDSLVKDLIMPAVALILPGDQGYVGWKLVVNEQEIPYGLFLGEVVNFLIVSLALFFFTVKFLGFILRAKKVEEAAPADPEPTKEELLLTEIRDLLKARG